MNLTKDWKPEGIYRRFRVWAYFLHELQSSGDGAVHVQSLLRVSKNTFHTMEEHSKSCMLNGYIEERIGKRIGYRLGRVNPATAESQRKASKLRLLTDQFADAREELRKHAYYPLIEEQARTGEKGKDISAMLQSRSAKRHMTVSLQPPPKSGPVPRKNWSALTREMRNKRKKATASRPITIFNQTQHV